MVDLTITQSGRYNFVLACYAGGDAMPKGRPFAGEPIIEEEPGDMTRSQMTSQPTVYGSGPIVQGNHNQ